MAANGRERGGGDCAGCRFYRRIALLLVALMTALWAWEGLLRP